MLSRNLSKMGNAASDTENLSSIRGMKTRIACAAQGFNRWGKAGNTRLTGLGWHKVHRASRVRAAVAKLSKGLLRVPTGDFALQFSAFPGRGMSALVYVLRVSSATI
jgi:hypothetical protein